MQSRKNPQVPIRPQVLELGVALLVQFLRRDDICLGI